MKLFTAACAALMACLSSTAIARSASNFEPLANSIRNTKHATKLPSGTAIAVVKDGKVIHEAYFGFADIEAGKPVTRDTVFYIASATKPFFALNALLEEEAGRLDTRTTLQQMFPNTHFASIDADLITGKDLLAHTSGVDNQPLAWATAYSGIHDAKSRLALVAQSRPDDETERGTFNYTNVGYNLFSVWQDQQLATPWQQNLHDNIFRPLGMRRTTASINKARTLGWLLAKPYSYLNENAQQPLYLEKSNNTMQAAGGLISSAPDLAKFLLAQLAKHDSKSISKVVINRSQQPQAKTSSQYLDFVRTGYAWGWYTGEYKNRKMLHHFGGFAGFHTHLSFMPEENIGLVVLNNEDVMSTQLTNLIADYVYGILLNEPDIQKKSAKRFDSLQTKASDIRVASVKNRQAINTREWNLSLQRIDYLGTYSNDLLGDITVRMDDQQGMTIEWGNLKAVATGAEQKDHVRVEFVPGSGRFLAFAASKTKVEAIIFEKIQFKKIH